MRLIDRSGVYPAVGDLTGESGWTDDLETEELADVLRSAMREEYADASDEEMGDALENVLDAMSPAEAFNFGSALSQIGKSAARLASDPAFVQVVRTAAPIAGGALGTVIGGPVGTALGSQLGSLAASALPARARGPAGCAPAPPTAAAVPSPGIAGPAPPSQLLPRLHRAPQRCPRRASRRLPPGSRIVRGGRLGRRGAGLSCSPSSPTCCGACWRRHSASMAVSRSAVFLSHSC